MVSRANTQRGNGRRDVVRSGFTLIELMAVITIIGIVMALAANQLARDPGTSTALPVVEARFHEARSIAMGEQERTRIVIHGDLSDTDNPERYLRYLDIAREEKDDEGEGTGVWKTVGSQGTLPQGVFFDSAASEKASALVAAANPTLGSPENAGFGNWEVGMFEIPGSPAGTHRCYFYEFNAEGICVQDGEMPPGAAVVLSRGIPQDGEDPILDGSDKVGFVVWRNGSTSIYRDTADLAD